MRAANASALASELQNCAALTGALLLPFADMEHDLRIASTFAEASCIKRLTARIRSASLATSMSPIEPAVLDSVGKRGANSRCSAAVSAAKLRTCSTTIERHLLR